VTATTEGFYRGSRSRDRTDELPGSDGEHDLQERLATAERAEADDGSTHEELTPRMERFVGERIVFFLTTADASGRTDCSPRLGPQGFVTVLDLGRGETDGDGAKRGGPPWSDGERRPLEPTM